MTKEDSCCAICAFNKMDFANTYCSNKLQKDRRLKKYTKYNDSCDLFQLRDESFYHDGRPIEVKK